MRAGKQPAGLGLENADKVDGVHVGLVFRPLFGGELPLVALFAQLVETGLQLWGGSQLDDPLGSLGRQTGSQRVEDALKNSTLWSRSHTGILACHERRVPGIGERSRIPPRPTR